MSKVTREMALEAALNTIRDRVTSNVVPHGILLEVFTNKFMVGKISYPFDSNGSCPKCGSECRIVPKACSKFAVICVDGGRECYSTPMDVDSAEEALELHNATCKAIKKLGL
jgi:hypothetical protein